jgi:hypothetical protein
MRRSVDRPALDSLYHAVTASRAAAPLSLWMSADNQLSLQQPGGGIADKQLGVAAIDPQHFKAERYIADEREGILVISNKLPAVSAHAADQRTRMSPRFNSVVRKVGNARKYFTIQRPTRMSGAQGRRATGKQYQCAALANRLPRQP